MRRAAREEWDKITSKLGASGFVAQYPIQIYHRFIILSSPQCRIIHFGGNSGGMAREWWLLEEKIPPFAPANRGTSPCKQNCVRRTPRCPYASGNGPAIQSRASSSVRNARTPVCPSIARSVSYMRPSP